MVVSSSLPTQETLIYNVKISSVGPGEMTRPNMKHEPTSIDLAMKFHYLKGVYYFKGHEDFESITISQIKEAMFKWSNQFYVICGRFRRSEQGSGRPYIKCNDCGARLMEAECAKTIEEWLELVNGNNSLQQNLIFGQPTGPEMEYSPNVYLQITRFRCGGMSLGLSWAHVLGDIYFASDFINEWGKIMAGHKPGPPPILAQYKECSASPKRTLNDPLSLKCVDPIGGQWVPTVTTKMESFSFHVSFAQLTQLQSKISDPGYRSDPVPTFESICALIWQIVAKIRGGPESKVVTILKYDSNKKCEKLKNENQVIGVVKMECSIAHTNLNELAKFLVNKIVDEREKIRETVEGKNGALDVIVYGANLTFVSFEEATFYELELKGQKPVHASYVVDGIGQGGAVFVLPTAKDGGRGRFVTITLPEKELMEVKYELKVNGLLAIE